MPWCTLVCLVGIAIFMTGDRSMDWVGWTVLALTALISITESYTAYTRGRRDGIDEAHQRGRQIWNRMVRLGMSEEARRN